MQLGNKEYSIFTVICGSFRKHLSEIAFIKKMLEENEVKVLSPGGVIAKNPDEEFIILDSDPISHPKILQDSVFAKIRCSTFVVIANIDHYIGKAALMEMGYAIAQGIDIYTIEPVDDPNLAPYCKVISEVFPEINMKSFSQ